MATNNKEKLAQYIKGWLQADKEIKLLEKHKLIEMDILEQLIIEEKLKIKYALKHPKSFIEALRPTQTYFTLDIQELKYIEPIFNILKQFFG